MTNNVGLPFSVGDTIPRFPIVLSKTTRIGDTLNVIFLSVLGNTNPTSPDSPLHLSIPTLESGWQAASHGNSLTTFH